VTIPLTILPWDSEFFGVPIGRITTAVLDQGTAVAVLDEARRVGLRCLYFEADPGNLATVQAAEALGFHLVDVRVVLEYSCTDRPPSLDTPPSAGGLLVDTATPSDLPRLEEIAIEVSRSSRYNFDMHFNAGQCERLYQTWIRRSLAGRSDAVFVARWPGEDREVAGLVTCAARDGAGHIELAGVLQAHRQKGVGTALMQAALAWAAGLDLPSVRVVTQARNVAAQRLYQQVGFFTRSMTLYYHKWL
jgi:dTDP-4-amino-4,6-dideoxy-D-galactose acyltransferase